MGAADLRGLPEANGGAWIGSVRRVRGAGVLHVPLPQGPEFRELPRVRFDRAGHHHAGAPPRAMAPSQRRDHGHIDTKQKTVTNRTSQPKELKMTMLAFHNDPAIKASKISQVLAHQQADEIVKGRYWEGGRGCAVGCTVHSDDHGAYETEMGIPRMIARLEDRIFEGMPLADAKTFPARFIEAIPVGADLSLVSWKFLHWLVSDVVDRHGTDSVKAATFDAIEVLRKKARGEDVAAGVARAAAREARHAAAAYDAAAYAAAADAAYADAVAYAAAAYTDADADADADAAAYAAAYNRQSDKLLELLAAAPVAMENSNG